MLLPKGEPCKGTKLLPQGECCFTLLGWAIVKGGRWEVKGVWALLLSPSCIVATAL